MLAFGSVYELQGEDGGGSYITYAFPIVSIL